MFRNAVAALIRLRISAMQPAWIVLLGALGLVATTSASRGADPRVKVLVPGITIEKLPIKLSNINSVEYGPDGRLYAAGYDGRIHVLTDSDGDGIEDKVTPFWNEKGDILTPVGLAVAKEGVYVAARGKIALLRDTDGDGRADTSETIVSGWQKENHNSDNRNDASGIELDAAGNLYFSLGCSNYNGAFLLDKKGKPRYSLESERGTILKVSADRKHREIVCTGLRFIVGLEFNRHGDLFASDQEGDTWFPGGNPRDEFLHIISGRHYGFPFRHPNYLPDVIDEPAVVGFSPQHQSACGFRFNEQSAGQKRFGPRHWEGNAIFTGFSRGKLWRVPLAKTRAGYVGKQILFASIEALPTDLTISPGGDLLVTCHSGHPDWGAGPAADGHLYKIAYDRRAPQPVAVWPAGPLEVKVAFDRPVDPERLGMAEIETGEFVREGDRHEWIWPGYALVEAEKKAVRRALRVTDQGVSDDGRTVTISTAPHPWRARYGVTLAGVVASGASKNTAVTTVELSYDLGGVSAKWTRDGDSSPSWDGWLPHVDTNVIRTLTDGSAEHARLLDLLNTRGRLSMRSTLLLPGKKVSLRFEGSVPFRVTCGKVRAESAPAGRLHAAEFTLTASSARAEKSPRGGREQVLPTDEVRLEIELRTGGTEGDCQFDVSYHADFDTHERPLRLEHFFVPWAPTHHPPESGSAEGWSGEVAGDPVKGREIFFGKEARCSTCHTFAGQGGRVAADLTVSVHRDPGAVLRDIVKPSDSINPDYVSYTVVTNRGEVLTGLFQSASETQIKLIDADAKIHEIKRKNIADIRASTTSLMPSDFDKLGKEKLENLVAFLCTEDAVAKKKNQPTGVILREYWLDVRKGGISGLTKHPDYPGKPSGTGLLTRFEVPANWKEYYGARVRGYIHPPQTGKYIFWVAADDNAELWLSSSENPSDRVRIVRLNRWTRSRDWDAYPEQKSKPILLRAGKRYYIEALQAEATVDDCLAVGWELPDGTLERPIPGRRLSSPAEGKGKGKGKQ